MLEGISSADFCDFWSSLAFASGCKVELLDGEVNVWEI